MVDQPDKNVIITNLDTAPTPTISDAVPQKQVRNGMTQVFFAGEESIETNPASPPTVTNSMQDLTLTQLSSLNALEIGYGTGTLEASADVLDALPGILDAYRAHKTQTLIFQAYSTDALIPTSNDAYRTQLLRNISFYTPALEFGGKIILLPPVGIGIPGELSIRDGYWDVVQDVYGTNTNLFVLGHINWRKIEGASQVDATNGRMTDAGHAVAANLMASDLLKQMFIIS